MQDAVIISDAVRAFLDRRRVAHLATADGSAKPHVVPVCFVLDNATVYVAIDEKPKRADGPRLKRLRNLDENPSVALVADRYDEDWSRLGWVMIFGRAEVLTSGPEHDRAQALLRSRYRQYRTMSLAGLPVIALRAERATSWGDLTPD